jgi:chemotaxis signal transduction protein
MDEAMRWVLEARARRYADAPPEDTSGAVVGSYAGCRIGGVVLGLPVEAVHEFAPLRHWTPLKGARDVLGVTHLRGDVMALLDLLAAVTGQPSGECGWMMVLQGRGGRAAVPVAEVLGTRVVRTADLLAKEQEPRVGTGVAAVTSDLWFLLDPDALRCVLDGAPERTMA